MQQLRLEYIECSQAKAERVDNKSVKIKGRKNFRPFIFQNLFFQIWIFIF